MFTDDYKQYIADVYHCSDSWGCKMTVEEMYIDLVESNKEKDPDDYCPDPATAALCAEYWNSLCEMYPA